MSLSRSSLPSPSSCPGRTPALRTRRLGLQPYAPADAAAFVALFTNETVTRWMGGAPGSVDEARELFDRIFTLIHPERRFAVWAVREAGTYVGHAELKPSDAIEGGHEIVCALAPHAWGRGLGTEVAEALVAHAFDALGLTEVHATVAAADLASLALLNRIGFRQVRGVADTDRSTTRVLTRPRERPIART